MEKYREQQLQQQERFNKWVQDQGWYETEIGGQKVLVPKSTDPFNQLIVKFEGGNLRMVVAGAQIAASQKWLFTIPSPITYGVGLVVVGSGAAIMWMGLPSVRLESRY
jgi:hypothetical protein